jgi:RNA polymerase subunit RPABC4/transcription elongation factor Spt4
MSVDERVIPNLVCPNCGKLLEATWKACPYCGTSQRRPTYEESLGIDHEYESAETVAAELPSRTWYLVPFLFGFIGGLIAYVGTRDRDKDMATKLFLFGLIWNIVLFFIVGWYSWLNPVYH